MAPTTEDLPQIKLSLDTSRENDMEQRHQGIYCVCMDTRHGPPRTMRLTVMWKRLCEKERKCLAKECNCTMIFSVK